MTSGPAVQGLTPSLRKMLVPLALAQFICSFAGSNMNVMINDISHDLHTDVQGVQVCITLFLLVMAALMIPCGKLTDRYGRKRLFQLGLLVYGIGAILSAASPGLGVLILGNSIFEGVGTALLIPPVYILTTMMFSDIKSRAQAFGLISGMGGIGAAAGPLIGGLITTAISWRAAFVFQALIIVIILILGRSLIDPVPPDPARPFDIVGAVLSAAGLVVLVGGILAADQNVALMLVLIIAGAVILSRVLRLDQPPRASREGGAVVHRPVPQPHLEPGPGHAERAMAGAAGHVVCRVRLPADGAALQRDPDRRDLHRRHRGHLAVLAGRRAPGQAVPAAALILAGFVITIIGIIVLLVQVKGAPRRLVLRPGAVPDRYRRRCHADAVGQRGAIRVSGEPPGRNLRPVPQRVEPGLVDRHRSRGHHPGRRSR